MTTPVPLEDLLTQTTELQGRAADPRASVWVSANAGTGKTHVLTNRVLRLLLSGTAPEQILCITYTKAAAAEMSRRIYDRLSEWVMAPQDTLDHALEALTGAPASAIERDRARTLFTSAIETPGGLKVLTIHSFCERLLQRFPLESGVAPGFRVIEDKESQALLRTSIEQVLTAASEQSDSALGTSLSSAIAYANDVQFDDILQDALHHRQWLADMHRIGDAPHGAPSVAEVVRRHFGLRDADTSDSVLSDMTSVLSDKDIHRVMGVLGAENKTDVSAASLLRRAASETTLRRKRAILQDLFLTKSDRKPRANVIRKALGDAHPDVLALLTNAQTRFVKLFQKWTALDIVNATLSLYAIADAVMQTYTDAKRRKSALDFPDLIERSVFLLDGDSGADWVQFKLDEGLSHILVDESQDTAPDQWRLIDALSREFFSGVGVHDEPRTVFAVGDEKQSIYSFQGAAPQEFKKQGAHFKSLATNAEQDWHHIPLTLSFRTTEPVLRAVDRVFSDSSLTPGVLAGDAQVRHLAKRIGQEGRFELWPIEQSAPKERGDPFLPLDEPDQDDATQRLADRIAETVDHWITTGEPLGSTGQPIKAGDILILVRKRHPMAQPIVAALKARGIPVSGADRIELLDQIAIQDILSLADFLTLPEDDLALAEVLKSPIFGLDDDDLLSLAPKRGHKTLWKMLLDGAAQSPRLREAAETLKRWRRLADFAPPYEFFARLFDVDKVREKLLARLGPDAGEALDEFIDLTLQFDEQEPPSLSGFLVWLRANGHEVKRDLDVARNEVRVMTVHGAKGLEAPIVILPDTCAKPGVGPAKSVLALPKLDGEHSHAPPFVWAVKGAGDHAAIKAIKSSNAAADLEESHRLLYVAMTRARDRLYVGGCLPSGRNAPPQCWYQLIDTHLRDQLSPAEDFLARPVLRLDAAQSEPLETPQTDKKSIAPVTDKPEWATTPAQSEPQISIPLAPSRLAPYETDEEGEPLKVQPKSDTVSGPSISAEGLVDDAHKFLRGNLTHALLQHLPNFATDRWDQIAEEFVATRGDMLAPSTRRSIVNETLNILRNPNFAPLFGPNSRAEVPLIALLHPPEGKGTILKLNGAIDRLVELEDAIFVVDYKTNRAPAATQDKVAVAYLYQLASYRVALREVYREKPIRAALLWTDGPQMMEISATILDRYEARLWQLKPADLDGA